MTTSFVANVVTSAALTPHTRLTHVSPVHFPEMNKMLYLKMEFCEKVLLHRITNNIF